MRSLRLLAPLALVAAASLTLLGCSGSDSTVPDRQNFNVHLEGMTPHLGHVFELRVIHRDTQNEVARIHVASVASATFDLSLPDILVVGERYTVDFYADLNRNHRYDAPPADHAWRRFIGPITGHTTLNFVHDAVWIDIEWPE